MGKPGNLRKLSIDGQGNVTLVRPPGGSKDELVPWGEYQFPLSQEELDRLLRFLRNWIGCRILRVGSMPFVRLIPFMSPSPLTIPLPFMSNRPFMSPLPLIALRPLMIPNLEKPLWPLMKLRPLTAPMPLILPRPLIRPRPLILPLPLISPRPLIAL